MSEEISNESLILKDELRGKRDRLGLSNQAVADLAGLSVYTVTNYFSNRSKATSAYTVGKICMALHHSFDRAFSIVPDEAEEIADLRQVHALELEVTRQTGEIERLKTVNAMLEGHAKGSHQSLMILICLCTVLAVALAAYLIIDANIPNAGLIKFGAMTGHAYLLVGLLALATGAIGYSVVRLMRRGRPGKK